MRMGFRVKVTIAVIVLFGIGMVAKVLFFQKSYWYEAQANESRVPVGSYILAADVSAGSGHLKGAMVNVWVRHQDESNRTPIEISIPCEAVNLLADGAVVKPNNPSACRNGAGQTGPSAYLMFTLPVDEPQKITLQLPPIRIRAQDGETIISPSMSIAYHEKSKRVTATFH